MTLPLAPLVGLAAGLSYPVDRALQGKWVGTDSFLDNLAYNYTGYIPSEMRWDGMGLLRGVVPLVAGLMVHKFVGGKPLNFNGMLAKSKVPFLRI